MYNDHGDSGAPVYRRLGRRRALASGVLSGLNRKVGRTRTIYSSASRIQFQLNVLVCTRGRC
jgi:hypothetical protein